KPRGWSVLGQQLLHFRAQRFITGAFLGQARVKLCWFAVHQSVDNLHQSLVALGVHSLSSFSNLVRSHILAFRHSRPTSLGSAIPSTAAISSTSNQPKNF